MDARWTWVATCVGWPNELASFLASTRKSLKKHFKADYPLFHWLIIGSWTSLNLRWLGLGGQTMKKLLWLVCKFDLDQSERKSSQINASARKAWPNGVADRPNVSTCIYLRLRLAKALATCVYLRGNLLVRLATQRKSLPKFNLHLLETTCRSVWPGLKVKCKLWRKIALFSQFRVEHFWPITGNKQLKIFL